jgi:hypothetical protein
MEVQQFKRKSIRCNNQTEEAAVVIPAIIRADNQANMVANKNSQFLRRLVDSMASGIK